MKKLLTLITFIFLYVGLQAQTTTNAYPIKPGVGNAPTTEVVSNAVYGKFIVYTFADTTAANLDTYIKHQSFAVISTLSPVALWYRYLAATQWIQILPAGGSSGQRAWLDGGNTSLLIDVNDNAQFGSLTAAGIKFMTNSTQRFILPKTGLAAHTSDVAPIGINSVTGNLSFYTPSTGITTASNGLTATGSNVKLGGTLIEATEIDADGFDFSVSNGNSITIEGGTGGTQITGGTLANKNAIQMQTTGMTLRPALGVLEIDTLTTNTTAQNTVMGWTSTGGGNRGQVGYLTLSGLSISAGVLTNSFTGTVTSVGFTGGLISVATATTTPAFTVAGTSGGIPYFSSTSTWASSGLLAANSIMIGGGAGTTPSTSTASGAIATLGGGASAAELRFLEPSGSGTNYTAWKAVAQAGDITYSLPPSLLAGGVLTDAAGDGVLTWAAPLSSVAWNAIANPTGDQALTFDAGESSTWTNSNTTEDLFTVNSSTMTTSSLFSLNSTSTTLASGNNLMELLMSGANGTNAITGTGLRISVTNTNATSGTNVGLNVTASGATTGNYALVVPSGFVGLYNSAPTSKLHLNHDANSVTQADANGLLLANATAAINNTQSISPPLILQGNGWATGVNNSQDVRFRMQVLPVQAATNPTATWQLQRSINGAAYATLLAVTSASGDITVGFGSAILTSTYISAPLNITSGGQINTANNTASQVYRTTNAGSNVTPVLYTGAPATNTAGTLAYGVDVTNGQTFTAANGTRQIARAGINITNLVNTAAAESGDLSFYVQAAGAAMAQRLVLASAGDLTLGGATTAPQFRLLEGSAGGTNYAGFQSPATLAGNTVYTMPTAFPAGTYLMNSTSAGVISFVDPATLSGLPYIALTGTSTATGDINVITGANLFNINGTGAMTFGDDPLGIPAGNGTGVVVDDASSKVTLYNDIRFRTYGAGALTTDASGNITATSDYRVKHNINSFSLGLKELKNVNPATYIRNSDWTNSIETGFIAQNIQSAFGGLGIGHDSKGMLTLSTNVILAATVNSIKELSERNDYLQRQIDELKLQLKHK